MDSKFPRRLGHRDHRIFQEITTPVFGITGHVAPRLHDTVGTQLIDFHATVSQAPYSTSQPGWFSRMKSKMYGSNFVSISSTQVYVGNRHKGTGKPRH